MWALQNKLILHMIGLTSLGFRAGGFQPGFLSLCLFVEGNAGNEVTVAFYTPMNRVELS